MTEIKPIRNLNDLSKGLNKQWIWQRGNNYYRSCDYLQKINYCIQDLNQEIEVLDSPSMKEVIYVIVLVDWIREATTNLCKLLLTDVRDSFVYSHRLEIDKANNYLSAIRSFAVAHPLGTDRHSKYGFDGDKICVDIRNGTSMVTKVFARNEDWYHLDFSGLSYNAKDVPSDFIMLIYSKKKDNMHFFQCIGADFSDLYRVAELQIEKLYDLDRHLSHLRKKDWL